MPVGIVLASASPRRAELLRELGIRFAVRASNIPEEPGSAESGPEFARRAAREKALAVAAEVRGDWTLGADTVVLLDGEILGKPVDPDDARRMLARLSGRAHRVVTGVALVGPDGAVAEELSVETRVEFRSLSASEIDSYVAGGEPLDKAGAYGIQGGASRFVSAVEGSYTNVVGLPVDEVRSALERHGILEPIDAERAGARPRP